jgi:N-acetyl sugar amidotransferase
MSKHLVLFTLEYPDPLLDKEIKWLAAEFDTIYLLPGKVRQADGLPPNVEIHQLFKEVDLNKPLGKLLKHVPLIIRLYTWAIFRSGHWRYYIKYIKSFLGYLLMEAERIEPLKKFIIQRNLQQAIFYDYWLVDSTLALAELKRKGLIRFTIARAHGFDLYHERQFEERVSYQAYRVNFLNSVFAISQHGYDYLLRHLPFHLRSKIKLSYLGTTSNFDGPLPQKKETFFTVVSCSNLISLKRIGLVIETLALTRLEIYWVHFGDGVMRPMLEEKARLLPGNVHVDFKGRVDNEIVLQFYQSHFVDLFISLSESEGLPVSMMEAISCGIPILACGVNGVPEIVTTETGILLPKEIAPHDVCQALEEVLLRKSFDREQIRDFCRRKFDAEKNFSSFLRQIRLVGGYTGNPERKEREYQQCTKCILDTQDSSVIEFDEKGVCSYCRKYEEDERSFVKTGDEGKQELERIVEKIKTAGRGKPYDSLLGISGGVDSTYLALQAKKLGLRPLLVHFDNGWNSELAVDNIEKIVSKLGFDLHTLVIPWEEFRDLQLAFLKASVVDIEMVTDHAILATLYKLAVKFNIKYILSGTNIVTEGVLPPDWIHSKRDHVHIQALQRKFNAKKLKVYPLLTVRLRTIALLTGVRSISPLNFIPYNKAKVKEELKNELGWRDYGGKHYESVFTRFYQGYILPTKFHIDKRKAHLSTLICSGQITREEAFDELSKPLYDEKLLRSDRDFVIKKLGLNERQFDEILATPPRPHTDYPVEKEIYERMPFFKVVKPFWHLAKRIFFNDN